MNGQPTTDFLNSLRRTVPTASVPVLPGTPGAFQVHAAGPAAGLQPGFYAQPPTPAQAPTAPVAPAAPPAETLPPWALSKTPYTGAASVPTSATPINPPESALPPAPPVAVAALAPEPKKRGRPASSKNLADDSKTIGEALAGHLPFSDLPGLVATMRALGVKEINLGPGGTLYGVELFEAKP